MTEITIELDDAREVMYDELTELFTEEAIEETLKDQSVQHLTQMYDNRDELQEKMEQQNGDI